MYIKNTINVDVAFEQTLLRNNCEFSCV